MGFRHLIISWWKAPVKELSKAEVVLRLGVSFLFSYALSVGTPEKIVAPSLAFVVGILGTTLSIAFPHLLFAMGAIFPSVCLAIIWVYANTAALLAAATVSDGLMVAMFSIFTFAMTGVYFGKNYDKTNGLASLGISITGLTVLSYRTLVQDGFSVQRELPNLQDEIDNGTAGTLLRAALSAICQQSGLSSTCWLDPQSLEAILKTLSPETLSIPLEGEIFGGQTAYVSLEDGVLKGNVPGGLWIVTGLWTWQGLDNPLAVFRNLFICVCWSLVAVLIGIILPPMRSARQLYSQLVAPQALQLIAKSYRETAETPVDTEESAQAAAAEKQESGVSAGDEDDKESPSASSSDAKSMQEQDATDADRAAAAAAIKLVSLLKDGDAAKVTLFEPYLCRAPLQFPMPVLQELLRRVSRGVLGTLTLRILSKRARDVYPDEEQDLQFRADMIRNTLQDADQTLTACAQALASRDSSAIDDMPKKEEQESALTGSPNEQLWAVGVIQDCATSIREATKGWLDVAVHPKTPPRKEALQNLIHTYLPWCVMPFFPIIRFAEVVLVLPWQPHRWNAKSLLWSIEMTLGYIALFVMVVYWDAFANFRLKTIGEEQADAGAVWYGWQLLGYAFATMPTMEGTVKKGLSRLFGTCLGGFLAWLGIIVASWSYDDNAEINPYGLVAWLTITNMICAWVGLEGGIMSFMGQGNDHGHAVMYTIMTEALIALEINAGSGSRDDLTINRIVATLTGVAMAMFIQCMPPYVRGGEPQHVQLYVKRLKCAMVRLLKVILHEQADSETVFDDDAPLDDLLSEVLEQRRLVLFLHKDAGRLKNFPILKLDERLESTMGDMAVVEPLLMDLRDLAIQMHQNPSDWKALGNERDALQAIIADLESPASTIDDSKDVGPARLGESDKVTVFVSVSQVIGAWLQKHEAVLNQVEAEHQPFWFERFSFVRKC